MMKKLFPIDLTERARVASALAVIPRVPVVQPSSQSREDIISSVISSKQIILPR
jgi:hypothetical protein